MPEQAVVTGLGVEAAGIEGAVHLLGALDNALDRQPAFDSRRRLGERGWRYHDAATLLALCAATEALAGLERSTDWDAGNAGVVVSSNLGNLDTVCRVVDALRAASTEALSPMDLPKASSNIIASTLAIHFDCRGLNLTVCNGASSGLDAVYLAATAVRAGRARRVLVVGVEPSHREARRLLEDAPGAAASGHRPLRGGAAGILVEAVSSARGRGARVYGEIGPYAHHHGPGAVPRSLAVALARERGERPALWVTPETDASPSGADVGEQQWMDDGPPPRRLDLAAHLGLLYGALGVFQCVAASLWLQGDAPAGDDRVAVLTSGGGREGASSLVLHA